MFGGVTPNPLVTRRLISTRLASPTLRSAVDVVGWCGAVQAQEYPAAQWALGLRARGLTDADVDRVFDAGAILRTHVLRPTWHFVLPADIRWMLALTAPRISRAMASYDRRLEIDARVRARSQTIIARALAGGPYLTRAELATALARAGIAAKSQRLGHLMLYAEIDSLVCSGPRRGRQFTYALLDERAPQTRPRLPEEAAVDLARRYFSSHGPATVRDFCWWSSVTAREARAAVEHLRAGMSSEVVDGRTYWFMPHRRRATPARVHLLPIYDEYLVAHQDRGPFRHPAAGATGALASDAWANWLLVDGCYAGGWRRVVERDRLQVRVTPLVRLDRALRAAMDEAAARYSAFLQRPVTWSEGRT